VFWKKISDLSDLTPDVRSYPGCPILPRFTVLHSSGEGLETGSGRKNTSLDFSLATLLQAENKVSCGGSVGYTVLHSSGEGLETGSRRKNTSLDSSLATLHQAENKVIPVVTGWRDRITCNLLGSSCPCLLR
jgi:hypothetical protein